jgi:uncharacterized membrane protein
MITQLIQLLLNQTSHNESLQILKKSLIELSTAEGNYFFETIKYSLSFVSIFIICLFLFGITSITLLICLFISFITLLPQYLVGISQLLIAAVLLLILFTLCAVSLITLLVALRKVNHIFKLYTQHWSYPYEP